MTQSLNIGISCFFQHSFFSNGLATCVVSLAAAVRSLGHKAILINTNSATGWFDDCEGLKDAFERRNMMEWDQKGYSALDIFIDVDGYIIPDARRRIAKRVVVFVRKPVAIFECEHTVYPINGPVRNLRDCDAVWVWDHFGAQDAHILTLLSEKPVFRLPYTWSPAAIEAHVAVGGGPSWLEANSTPLTAELPWTCHIVETNQSTVSNATIPVVSVAYAKTHKRMRMEKCFIHNGQMIQQQQFFTDNVLNHCKREGLEFEFVGRQRIADWRNQLKSFVLSHTRFVSVRGTHLDCVWNGIPMAHNSPWLRDVGCSLERYYYADNSIKGAAAAMQRLADDFEAKEGMFAAGALEKIRVALLRRLDPCTEGARERWDAALTGAMTATVTAVAAVAEKKQGVSKTVLKVGFSDLWDDANHEYNFWTLLLEAACARLETPIQIQGVKITQENVTDAVDLLIFGPFGSVWTSVPSTVPKVHITGENTRSKVSESDKSLGVYLNLGFEATDPSRGIYRFPLWIQYIDWFGADQERLVNPRSMPLDYMTRVDPELLKHKSKFCSFIVSNPSNEVRNQAFMALNAYKRVDSAGRLFNNIGDAIFTQVAGGGGGELKKLEFLKDYKFSITYENSRAPGYVTEKILAAKAAGCVPIYWGAPDVVQDFPAGSFINANEFQTAEELIAAVRDLDENAEKWLAAASVPAIQLKKERARLAEVAKLILAPVLGGEKMAKLPAALGADDSVKVMDTATKVVEQSYLKEAGQTVQWNGKTLLVTYATQKFLESLVNWIGSATMQKKGRGDGVNIRVYVGDDIDMKSFSLLRAGHPDVDFRRLPTGTKVDGFPDLWSAEHFAWKIWIYQELVREADLEGTLVWYSDSGSIIVRWPEEWFQKVVGGGGGSGGICMLEDKEQKNDQWCHDAFCKALSVTDEEKAAQQIVGGIVTFVGGSSLPWNLFTEAWKWAQQREVIAGPKWTGVRADGKPYGHRHDQSILSILRLRYGVPVYPLERVYCHESLRRTYKSGCALYVHRGAFKEHEDFAPRIGEAHVINLARRTDRLKRFKENHEEWTKAVCLRPAYDGKHIQMTPDLARLFAPNDFFWKKAVLGCAMSHLSLWIELANEKPCVENFLILEDDVKFQKGWLQTWKEAAPHIPADYDVLYLGGVLPPNKAVYEQVVEPVNQFWGRVALNQIFGQQTPSRYFHFCNYSYILSRRGAQKILEEMQRRGGYYTSADHMICNRVGDMNHYVLIPPVAGCYQDDDPKYAASEFNNFNRVDGFDSDLWNNDERWSNEEIQRNMEKSSGEVNIGQVLFQHREATDDKNPAKISSAPLTLTGRFFTAGDHRLVPGALLEFSWLEELFGPELRGVNCIPVQHEALTTTPVFFCAKPHFEDYMRVFTMYESLEREFIVVHLSDEYGNDPLDFYKFKSCKQVIRIYPRDSVPCPEKVLTIPLGPYRHAVQDPSVVNPELLWAFFGTGWKEREGLLEPLKSMQPHKATFFRDWMDASQLDAETYVRTCQSAVFMPCPGGQNPETFRFWEALEFGCIPIYVRCPNDQQFYGFISKKLPIISFNTWQQAAGFMQSLLQNGASLVQYRKTMLEKWAAWKAELRAECRRIIS
jgi:GR25 family glycosyltransferase involved in LPS biosynthesis